ncbi:MAG: phosphoenolpyruvate carboxylase [Candidatus Puniceispirillaceae bacterium]
MAQLIETLTSQLHDLRLQGMKMAEINPIAALAGDLFDQLEKGDITFPELEEVLEQLSHKLWHQMSERLVTKTGLDSQASYEDITRFLGDTDCETMIYRAVFTAHPVFALRHDKSQALCENAVKLAESGIAAPIPQNAFDTRQTVSLQEEHQEAMSALEHARLAISDINRHIITYNRKTHPDQWRDKIPHMMGVATWVGYDLDGRTDITWSQSIALRLNEKRRALQRYLDALSALNLDEVAPICQRLEHEISACAADYEGFTHLCDDQDDFAKLANQLTARKDKMTKPLALVDELHQIAKSCKDDKQCEAILIIAADIKAHGFGMGEIHLRINAVQLRNAMRTVDGRSRSASDSEMSSRLLLDRLAKRIETEDPWQINFASLDKEAATARRQLMLAAQILKHIDSDMPIRLLIAECEKPITFMSALYLAHKLGIADKIDISPLFETTFGLQHGVQMMTQLLAFETVQAYVRKRGRLAIQAGFSDAGRFMGQIAANLAIERLQIKLASLCHEVFGSDIELLIFNTHGESMGRGCARPTIADRQNFIFTPFSRHHARQLPCPIHHQSSFQGGDGYRNFGTKELAYATMSSLFMAELAPASQEHSTDPFYRNRDFSLDLFLSLKKWHEDLFKDPQYGQLLDVFGPNLLPKTGSRPAKRKLQAGAERLDPSKIRAIPHNAILQQLGFLAVVISGMGTASMNDNDRFVELHDSSPRLQQILSHVTEAKQLGSLNTMLAYGRLMDNGFWIDKAYHGTLQKNQRALRQIAHFLRSSTSAIAVRQTVWKLREDLIDLYRITGQLTGSVRTTGFDRTEIDLLQSIRVALITQQIVQVFQVPRFTESNQHSQTDLFDAAMRLDFAMIEEIVRAEFPADPPHATQANFEETETYGDEIPSSYGSLSGHMTETLARNKKMIHKISQMISAHYGAHG